ncbi:hypothetical protein NQ317_005471 [Molorchus minor]|uniref:RNA-directed DNA polymerase n=1 Tax=Molorchus minor TaxID=1323400 RepID=A0ABQ9JWW3_9CUCU|nr:hypothetical protein NQ317_000171 [Molorchus minor]KAJ8982377.1 hypothetical protein NQ317_005471 [Molorchus minor]
MVIDTGSYHTIVKPNILAHCKMKPTTNNFILETAGGETLPVIGVHEAEFQLGRTVFRHQVFVANITDDVLMGLELMKKHGFQLNLQERSIKTGHDEIIISMPRSDEKVRRITLTEDVILPAWSETIVMVNLEPGEDDGQVELIEPDLDEDIVKKGLLVAKTLTQRKNNTVPVRLVNLKNCDQKLKNGDVLGKSQAVTCITKCEDIGEGPSYCDNEEIPEKGQIARWLQRLQEYDFKIEHRKGRLHGNADAISRRPCAERCSHCKRAENKEFGSHCRRTAVVNDDNWETKKLAEEQQKDEDIKPFITWKEEGTRPEWKDISNKSTTLKGYWAIWDSLIVEDGILKRLWEDTDGKEIRKQIVLPRARVNEVLQEVHGGVGGGHFGVNKTLNKVRERFYWLRSRADVEDWCRRCAECASSKGPRTRSRGQMKQELRLPFDLRFGHPEERADDTVEDYSLKLATRIDAIHNEARKKLQFESDRLKTRYDARSNNSGYQAGDEVWLYNPARRKGRSPKLQKSWEGPYTVIKRINDLVYRIQRGPRAKMKVVHLDRLAPYRRPHEELVDRDDHP